MFDDLRERISLPGWDSLSKDEMEAAARHVERVVTGARFVRLEEHAQADQKRRVAVFEVNGVEMALVPGGRRMLGFDRVDLEASARAAWEGSFREVGHPVQQLFEGIDVSSPMPAEMVQYLTTWLSPRREVLLDPFLLERGPSVADDDDFDEEDDEIVDDAEELRHGDGGGLVCGASGPIAWITFSPWYRYRLSETDDREIWFEDAHLRRARSIFPRKP